MARSHTQELLADPKPRNACDRCHAQKMRCLKEPGDDRCLRCVRQDAVCQYSPRTRRRAEKHQKHPATTGLSPSSTSESLFSTDHFPTDPIMATPDNLVSGAQWSPFTFNLDTNTLPWLNDCTDSGNLALASTTKLSVADAVRELADLHVRLFDHSCTLPPPTQQKSTSAWPSASGRLFIVDQTFTLSKTLINILERLHTCLDDGGPDNRPIDQATALLILSCHHRLMDTYGSIFGHIQVCSQTPSPQGIPLGCEPAVTLPPLQFGSYTAPGVSNTDTGSGSVPSPLIISMHMMLIMMASSQLCKQLREAIGKGMGQDGGEVDGQPTSIFDEATQDALRQRWAVLGEKMSSAQKSVMLFSAVSMSA